MSQHYDYQAIAAAMQQYGGQEEQPSITNPITTYGLLIRALRLVAGTTLMEMSESTGWSPAFLSSVEFGREVASEVLLKNTRDFFADKGIQLPAGLLERAAKEQ